MSLEPAHLDPATEQLIRDHLGIVYSLANRVRAPHPYDRDDLVEVGLIALLLCARRWRPDGGAAFASYAHFRVHGAMIDFCRSHSWGFSHHHGERRAQDPTSFDPERDADARADDYSGIDRARRLRRLPLRERFIALAFEAGYTQAEIARMLGLSDAGIAHIRERSIRPRLAA